MNDYQMTILSADRRSELQAEADRQRLARSASPRSRRRPSKPQRGFIRMGLGLLLGRLPASGRPSA